MARTRTALFNRHTPGGVFTIDDFAEHPGELYFLDPNSTVTNGDGTSPDSPVLTLAAAYALLTTNANDSIYYVPGSSGLQMAATLTWSKNFGRLFGVGAPAHLATRARIGMSDNFATMLTISGSGNWLRNVYFQHGRGSATNVNRITITGHRNVFENVHFAGPQHATEAGTAGYRGVIIDGGQENFFKHCVFGTDTIPLTDADTALLEFKNGAARNVFEDCLFTSASEETTPDDVLVAAAGGIDRFALFNRCTFVSFSVNWANKRAGGISIPTGASGVVILKDCTFVNYTDVFASGTNRIWIDGAAPTTTTSGLAVAPA